MTYFLSVSHILYYCTCKGGNYICLSRMGFVTFGITLEFNLMIPHKNMILQELNIHVRIYTRHA